MEIGLPDESLVKQFLASSKCEVCGLPFEESNINVLDHDDKIWILQVSCGGCHSQSLLAGMNDEFGEPENFTGTPEAVTETGPVQEMTDLREHELERYSEIVITVNDVTDMHIFLDNFGGNISNFLN
jgi:hypothetical protein